jgi:hypothetical protein
MRDAARALREGRGRDALELQRQAQRLLEQSETGKTDASEAERQQQRDPKRGDGETHRGKEIAQDGEVPEEDEADAAEDFRRRVLRGLSEDKSERLAPAVKRYAEGLLR